MASHQITCVTKETVKHPSSHEHIVSVGTAGGSRYSVAEVIAKMKAGDTFHTVSPSKGTKANVEHYECRVCKAPLIRTKADAEPDNNLDNLPKC